MGRGAPGGGRRGDGETVSTSEAVGDRGAFGVYVHVPFCAVRCDYCAFATYVDRDHLMPSYADACVTEVRRAVVEEGLPEATSVFFGGGTPSRLPAHLLAAVLDAIVRAPGCEVTVECNPEDVTDELLDAYLGAGVTRISLGVQSTSPRVLLRGSGVLRRGPQRTRVSRGGSQPGIASTSWTSLMWRSRKAASQ